MAHRVDQADRSDRPSALDLIVAVASITFAALSLVAMVIVVATGEQSVVVAIIEVATWTGATLAVALILWRQTIWGRR